MKKMSKAKITKIFEVVLKLAFTAVVADLFYIIARVLAPAVDVGDALFVHAVPDMLCHMLLSVAVIAAFMAAMTYIIREGDDT